MSNRRLWIGACAIVLVTSMSTAACGVDDGGTAASTTAGASTSTIAVSSSTSTATVSLPPVTTTRGAVPPAVQVVTAEPAGGSGEIRVRWDAVADVTGYRVLRANAQSGPFTVGADLDVATGKVTVGSDVTNVFSRNHTYHPSGAAAAAPDPSPWFEYIELVSGGAALRYFRVVAYNANGDAAASITVCGSPPGRPTC